MASKDFLNLLPFTLKVSSFIFVSSPNHPILFFPEIFPLQAAAAP
jgi:hypothetical protein